MFSPIDLKLPTTTKFIPTPPIVPPPFTVPKFTIPNITIPSITLKDFKSFDILDKNLTDFSKIEIPSGPPLPTAK